MRILRFRVLLLLFFLSHSCIEEYDFKDGPEGIGGGILVIEAFITDQKGFQQIRLSRTVALGEAVDLQPETDANVRILAGDDTVYTFISAGNGTYVSEFAFGAQMGEDYVLEIESQGQSYVSTAMQLQGSSEIENIYVERGENEQGEDGMTVYVDSSSPEDTGRNYRYTYEETYKIIAPRWNSKEFEITDDLDRNDPLDNTADVRLIDRTQEERICYNTTESSEILLNTASGLNTPRRDRNQIRFMGGQDPRIMHRYSILVKQYVHSLAAYTYLQTLGSFAVSDNLLSQVQPGFIGGNIRNPNNFEEKVLGFFDVVGYTEKRLYFNYLDYYDEPQDTSVFFGVNCTHLFAPRIPNPERDGVTVPGCPTKLLIDWIKEDAIVFQDFNTDPPPICEGPYMILLRPCGDCTALGSNQKPDFWVD